MRDKKAVTQWLGDGVVVKDGLLVLAAVLGAGLRLGLAAFSAIRALFGGEGTGRQGGDGGRGDEREDGFHDVFSCVVFCSVPA